jgi:sulfate adenylyltransferase subunit 1 (EFTu-like GTPase family)
VPGHAVARVAAIETFDGALASAVAGQSVSLRLDREIDISRGDWLVAHDAPPASGRTLQADVAWLDAEGFDAAGAARRLWLQHGTRSVHARVRRIEARLDLSTAEWRHDVGALQVNDIARLSIETQAPLAFDPYTHCRASGAFVLVDPTTHHTLAAGMIRGAAA